MLRSPLTLLILLNTIPVPLRASVIYTFSAAATPFGGNPAESLSFQLTIPTFLAPSAGVFGQQDFTCAQLDSSSNCGAGVIFDLFSDFSNTTPIQHIQFDASDDVGYGFTFPTGAFSTFGTTAASSSAGSATLTVSPTPLSASCAAAIQNAVVPINNGTTIQATFKPNLGMTLAQAAAVCGVTRFDWQQTITTIPDPVPLRRVDGTPINSTSTPFIDPPPGGGYTYCQPDGFSCNSYPFYYSPETLNSACAEVSSSVCILPVITGSGTTLNFYDAPADPCIDGPLNIPSTAYLTSASNRAACNNSTAPYGSFIGFRTQLVGVTSNGSLVAFPDVWTWVDTFNGTSNDIAATANNLPIDSASGTGGITITGEESLSTPEPASFIPFCLGLSCLALLRRATSGNHQRKL